jgi:hypothetical protein
MRKSAAAARSAQKKILQNNKKKGRKTKPDALEAAQYICVFTTLDKSIPAETILMIYRKVMEGETRLRSEHLEHPAKRAFHGVLRDGTRTIFVGIMNRGRESFRGVCGNILGTGLDFVFPIIRSKVEVANEATQSELAGGA